MSTCENKGLIWLKYFLPLMLTGKMKDNVILTSSKPFLFQIQNWFTCVSKVWAVERIKTTVSGPGPGQCQGLHCFLNKNKLGWSTFFV